MQVFFATDHAGFALKETLTAFVRDVLGYDVVDCGAPSFDADDDYPGFVASAARMLLAAPGSRAIILGGSGQGEAMTANRFKGVRATVYYGGPEEIITLSREHNDANVLSLGARFVDEETAKRVVELWLSLPFSQDERHVRRVQAVDEMTS